jgi:preprotein translocase subunit SecF
MFIINHKKIFIGISALLVALSIASIAFFGLPLGIDFKGGAMTQVSYTDTRPDVSVINESLGKLNLGQTLVQPVGENDFSIKTKHLTEQERISLISVLKSKGTLEEKGFTSIGPSVGKELVRKVIIATILVALIVILFIAYAFRGVSYPVKAWKYGVVAIGTLLHDAIIPAGIFAILAKTLGAEVDTLFVVALLTILGLSISDTIVIFDRVRENLKLKKYATFQETVGNSIEQSFARSINTSLSTIIVLVCLTIFGPDSTRIFSMMLAAGMIFGTYSSIFLASPLLVTWFEKQK